MVLLAQTGMLAEITALVGALTALIAGVFAFWKYIVERRERINAEKDKRVLEAAADALQLTMERALKPLSTDVSDLDKRLAKVEQILRTRPPIIAPPPPIEPETLPPIIAIPPIQPETPDAISTKRLIAAGIPPLRAAQTAYLNRKRRKEESFRVVKAIEEQGKLDIIEKLTQGTRIEIDYFRNFAKGFGDVERCLWYDANVKRLLKKAEWSPAAEAAIAFFVLREECTDLNWPSSDTWQQVQAAHEVCVKGECRDSNSRP
jgi:hypothetical protein